MRYSDDDSPKTGLIKPPLGQLISGLSAGFITTTCLHPLDLIKTRMQLTPDYNLSKGSIAERLGIVETIREFKVLYNEKTGRFPLSLYRGFTANLAGSTASWGFYFMWYSLIKDKVRSVKNLNSTEDLNPVDHLGSAATAGMLTSLMTNPIWLVKTRLCIQDNASQNAYKGLVDALKRIYVAEGFRGLYKGLVPAMMGVSHGAIQFMFYEELKKALKPKTDRLQKFETEPSLSTLTYVFMAASSKALAVIITYPLQVMKSRLQDHRGIAKYEGTLDVVLKIVRSKEGWRGLYRGLAPNLIRLLPATMITFAVYENVSFMVNQVNDRYARL